MLRRLLIPFTVLALLAASCSSDDDTTSAGDDPGADVDDSGANGDPAEGPQTVTVSVDAEAPDNNVAFLSYFPAEVTVRPGDTIDFAFEPGDPHTVTFGALVEQMLAAGPDADGPPPIPFALDEENNVIQAAAQPCFVADGEEIPDEGACDTQEAPDFSGSAAFYNSGLLEPGASFEVTVADDAAEGTYTYICLLHGPDMAGTVTVAAADADVPSAADVDAAAQAEVDAVLADLQAALDGLDEGVVPALEGIVESGPGKVLAGTAAEGVAVDVLEFGPSEVEVAAGDTVTWTVLGAHTISFNATEDATPPVMLDADGNVALNPLSFAPQGGWPGMPEPPEGGGEGEGEGDEGGPPTVIPIDAGEWDGTGFVSSGALFSFPPALFSYSVTFTEAGTYNYVCLIHQDMEGTVTVS